MQSRFCIIGHGDHLKPYLKTFNGAHESIPSLVAGTATLLVVPGRHARLHMPAESIPWNRFLGSLKVLKIRAQQARTLHWSYK
jgi:hypothetical protein